jgi:serine protease Do
MNSESNDRVKCPSCAEWIAAEAKVCPKCQREALVDVVLDGPVSDARLRYQVARQLTALGPPYPPLPEIQRRLTQARPVVGERMTALDARRGIETIRPLGVAGQTRLAGAQSRARGSFARWPLAWLIAGGGAVLVLLVVASLGLVWWRHSQTRASEASRTTPAPTAPTARMRPSRSLSTQELAQRVLPSTVTVHCGPRAGAGFFVTEETVLTNAHVVAEGLGCVALRFSDGRQAVGLVARKLEAVDLALINVLAVKAPPLPLGDAGATQVGERVMLVGNPQNLEFTVHEGMISNVSRTGLGTAYLQLDAAINPGNSGGPVVNMEGQVIGVVTLKERAEGIGFALPINYAFTGPEPLLAAPSSIDPSHFGTMLTRASDDEKEEIRSLGTSASRPGLVKAEVQLRATQYGSHPEFLLYVAVISRTRPEPTTQQFNVWSELTQVCSQRAEVSEWKAVEGATLATLVDQRTAEWLKRHDLDARIFMGTAHLARPPCPELRGTYVIELAGAEPRYSQVEVN